MSLVTRPAGTVRPWHSAGPPTSHIKLPKLKKPPAIDYDQLRRLCSIEGLTDRANGINKTSEEAHEAFMSNYTNIFVKPPKKLGFPIHTESRLDNQKASLQSITHNATGKTPESDKKKPVKEWPIDKITHDIKDYLPLLHKQRKIEDPELIRQENLKTLRRLLKKLPFQRTANDNDKIFSILQTFPFFRQHIPGNVLKELCVVARHEAWKDSDFTVFGNSGLHMVLSGTVAPLTRPYVNMDEGHVPREPTPLIWDDDVDDDDDGKEDDNDKKPVERLSVGDCFGTLRKVEGREPGSKVFSVVTKDANCEFMKIPASDYIRVIEQIHQREHTEKVNLLLSCGQYKLWPRQPLLKVAELIEWITYPPNTVLASEEYKAPYAAIVRSGSANVLKTVSVCLYLPGGKREKRTKQVVMGRLGPSESFAELSVLLNEQITCSVVTATEMELGVIKPERIQELDEVTIQLFKQSNTRTFGNLTKEDIQEEYMQQELKREWNEFKHTVVLDIINSRGIRPGYGKWSK